MLQALNEAGAEDRAGVERPLTANLPAICRRRRGIKFSISCLLLGSDGLCEQLPAKFFTYLDKGGRLRIETPGGGGWDEPALRSRDQVRHDVAEGLVSEARAREIYKAK